MASKADPIEFTGTAAFWRRHREGLLSAVDTALQDGEFLGGSAVGELETRMTAMTGRRFAVAVNSATDALTIGLRAARVGPGDEVILTAFSFIASASPILLLGATPVFIDIDPQTYLMDVDRVQEAVTERTKAIVAVQLFGQCLPRGPLQSLVHDHKLVMIEDAAQATGARQGDYAAGSLGHISVFSFDPSKALGGLTTGGVLLTDDPVLHELAVRLRSHGWQPSGDFASIGYNSRMSTLNAAALLYIADRQRERTAIRERLCRYYSQALADVPAVSLPTTQQGCVPNWSRFVVRTPYRNALRHHLRGQAIETRIHYPHALPDIQALRGRSRVPAPVHHARRAAAEVLSLPVHAELNENEAARVIESVLSFFSAEIVGSATTARNA